MAQAMTRDTRRRERNRAKSVRYRRRKRARLSNYQATSESLHAHCSQYHAAIVKVSRQGRRCQTAVKGQEEGQNDQAGPSPFPAYARW